MNASRSLRKADVIAHGFGGVGHVQLVTGRASDIDKAAAAIEDAYDLLPGSVVVDSGTPGSGRARSPCAFRHSAPS
ncbi:hypothetical protein [Streptomyces sp. NPDC058667]|uniref:hypothetical protein n=1 Tax=Streptomyces sp. NPDC058667 TaxID=3346588 RepID=UPI00364C3A3E